VGTSAFDQLFGSSPGAPWAKPLFFIVVGTFIAITGAGEKLGCTEKCCSCVHKDV
jgi:hypothetical protein